jgi:hypothetical protein
MIRLAVLRQIYVMLRGNLGLMKERAQKLHKMVYALGRKYPHVHEFDDDGELHDAIHDLLRVHTPTALSSQAPKPASAGGVRVVSQAVLQAAYEHIPTCQGGHTSEFVSGWSSCLEYLARTIAADADTAKDGAK